MAENREGFVDGAGVTRCGPPRSWRFAFFPKGRLGHSLVLVWHEGWWKPVLLEVGKADLELMGKGVGIFCQGVTMHRIARKAAEPQRERRWPPPICTG